ncbi:RDD family protein [Actinacidiphila yanglinensis]|uniref:RDD family protein n=2 Tax=Actinacidiphila yanglinensis TaxID=310779 RepID=A0A1H6D2K3_9ACTN|nr:RDD family protein [Actinacidiphila yanglinensis]
MAPLATLGQRFLARLIDTVVLVAVVVLVSWAALGDEIRHGTDEALGKRALVAVLGYILYFAIEGAMTAARGQTVGKLALRIRAARLVDGGVPGSAGWLRAAVYVLPAVLSAILIGPFFWLVNSLWCTWDRPFQQCLHDKAAKTVVVAAL